MIGKQDKADRIDGDGVKNRTGDVRIYSKDEIGKITQAEDGHHDVEVSIPWKVDSLFAVDLPEQYRANK